MNIIGIDPSAHQIGFCIAKGTFKPKQKLSIVDYGMIQFSREVPIEEKLIEMHDGIQMICKDHKPDIISIEDIYTFNQHPLVGLNLSMTKAATIIGACKACSVKPSFYVIHATTVKKCVTDKGRATKDLVAETVSNMFDIDITDVPYDVTDAIAIAYTGFKKHYEATEGVKKSKKKKYQTSYRGK